ncbi:MAG: hypothetical protein U0521_22970 [Anaerolineae bacterium]
MSDQSHDTQPYAPVIEPPVRVGQDDEEFDTQAGRRGGGCGCWVTAITTLVVFVVLVGIGLFLPPINLLERLTAPRMTTLTASANAVSGRGIYARLYDLTGGDTLGVSISSVPMNRFLAGDASAGSWIPMRSPPCRRRWRFRAPSTPSPPPKAAHPSR